MMQFGKIKPEEGNEHLWNIDLDSGVQLSINKLNWDVSGSDEDVVQSVRESIATVLEII